MMEAWRKIRLGDACKTNADSYSSKEEWDFVNYLDTGNITNNRMDAIQYIDVKCEKLPSRARRKVKKDSIIYSTVRPNQRHFGIIKSQPENFLVSTGFVVIDVNAAVLDADFLYYLLTQDTLVESLHVIAEQSTSIYPSVKASDIEDLEIEIPDLVIQKKIADVLCSLDRKITQNVEINKNLDEQAQAIFDAWFIRFDIFDGNIPNSWKILKLSDVAKLSAGGDKPAKISAVNSEECPYPIYSNGTSLNGLYGYTDKPTISEESVTVSARGTIGFVCLRHTPYVPIVRLISIIPKKECISAKYLYFWLKNLPIAGTGTTQQQLTVPLFKNTEILVPSTEIITDFTDTVSPLFNLIYHNENEIERLSSIRDALLPRLMSGELDVSDIAL